MFVLHAVDGGVWQVRLVLFLARDGPSIVAPLSL